MDPSKFQSVVKGSPQHLDQVLEVFNPESNDTPTSKANESVSNTTSVDSNVKARELNETGDNLHKGNKMAVDSKRTVQNIDVSEDELSAIRGVSKFPSNNIEPHGNEKNITFVDISAIEDTQYQPQGNSVSSEDYVPDDFEELTPHLEEYLTQLEVEISLKKEEKKQKYKDLMKRVLDKEEELRKFKK